MFDFPFSRSFTCFDDSDVGATCPPWAAIFAFRMHFHFVRAFVFSCFLFRVLGRPPWPTSAPVHVGPHGESRRELTLAREGPSWPTSASVRSPWFSGLILVVIFLEWSWTVGRVVLRPQGVVSFGCFFPCAMPGPTPVQLRALGPGPGRFVSGGPGCPPGTPPFPTPPGHFWPKGSPSPACGKSRTKGTGRGSFVLFVLFGCWPCHGPIGPKKTAGGAIGAARPPPSPHPVASVCACVFSCWGRISSLFFDVLHFSLLGPGLPSSRGRRVGWDRHKGRWREGARLPQGLGP